MKLLGLNSKPLVAGGKAIIPPSAGSSVDAQTNTITPERYTVDLDNFTCYLNLDGLITGKYFMCTIDFVGESLSIHGQPSGDENNYILTIQYIDDLPLDESMSIGYCCGPEGFGVCPMIFANEANHVLDLSTLMESMKKDEYGMALNIATVQQSLVVSWD